ncbi:hypothetical protein MNB_SM-4-1659 [hydrothermal vent metagenome]|uniref:STAS/SEC14 domain-containing protein n=1 Tax=hydrothermal vent metagenome TaxID=652676 RepID=A0A1W1BH07_9ZZZZ
MQITPNMEIDTQLNGTNLDITLKATGTLTHKDYEVMVPMLEQAVQAIKVIPNTKVNMLIDATEFTGWEAQAAWDDFKFGMVYKDIFLKIAIVGTKQWQEYLVKMGNWFMDGEVKFFYDLDEATTWIK